MDRRTFLGSVLAASLLAIVPRQLHDTNLSPQDPELDLEAIARARDRMEDVYREIPPDTPLTSELHLYLSRSTAPFTEGHGIDERTAHLEKLLADNKAAGPSYIRGEAYMQVTAGWEHTGQTLMLLHLLADSGLVSPALRVGNMYGESVSLDDPRVAMGATKYLSPDLDGAAWALINLRSLPRHTRIYPSFEDPTTVGDLADAVYQNLAALDDGLDSPEYLGHGSVTLSSYSRHNPTDRTGEQMQTLYGLCSAALARASPDNLHALGHYLETIGRIAADHNFDLQRESSLLIPAVNAAADLLYRRAGESITKDTHCLMGIEIVSGMLDS